jgi:hypothetical protein
MSRSRFLLHCIACIHARCSSRFACQQRHARPISPLPRRSCCWSPLVVFARGRCASTIARAVRRPLLVCLGASARPWFSRVGASARPWFSRLGASARPLLSVSRVHARPLLSRVGASARPLSSVCRSREQHRKPKHRERRKRLSSPLIAARGSWLVRGIAPALGRHAAKRKAGQSE